MPTAASLKAAPGCYLIKVQFIGYKTVESEIEIEHTTDAGVFTLLADDTRIDDVVVTAQLIRREADRFVVDVANSPVAVGKNAEELLKTAPGVWINDDKVSINGNGGSKIYINDREVHMSDAQLMTYLRSLKSGRHTEDRGNTAVGRRLRRLVVGRHNQTDAQTTHAVGTYKHRGDIRPHKFQTYQPIAAVLASTSTTTNSTYMPRAGTATTTDRPI